MIASDSVGELERQTQVTIDQFPDGAMVETGLGSTVLDLIADWRAMRDVLEEYARGSIASYRARSVLDELKLKP